MSRKSQSDGGTGNTNLPANYMPEDKLNVPNYERSVRFGKSGHAIPASTVFHANIDRFSKKSTLAEKWIAVNEEAGTMTFINTYDGKTGEGYDAETFTFPLDPKRLDEKRQGMQEVSVDDCPVCITLEQAKSAKIVGASAEQHAGT